MTQSHLSSELTTLGQYLTGEFTNQRQALAQPAWFVNLHLWFCPVALFSEDSITLFTEQANVVNLQPYRPRLLRLCQDPQSKIITVQYYQFHHMEAFKGSGCNPKKLQNVTAEDVQQLTDQGCCLKVEIVKIKATSYHFKAFPITQDPCCFTYQNQRYKIALGFEVNEKEYISHEKGINLQTGKPTWGLMGAYCFEKIKAS